MTGVQTCALPICGFTAVQPNVLQLCFRHALTILPGKTCRIAVSLDIHCNLITRDTVMKSAVQSAVQSALLPATEAASLQELTGCRQTLATIRHSPVSPRQPIDQESAAVLMSTGALFQSTRWQIFVIITTGMFLRIRCSNCTRVGATCGKRFRISQPLVSGTGTG